MEDKVWIRWSQYWCMSKQKAYRKPPLPTKVPFKDRLRGSLSRPNFLWTKHVNSRDPKKKLRECFRFLGIREFKIGTILTMSLLNSSLFTTKPKYWIPEQHKIHWSQLTYMPISFSLASTFLSNHRCLSKVSVAIMISFLYAKTCGCHGGPRMLSIASFLIILLMITTGKSNGPVFFILVPYWTTTTQNFNIRSHYDDNK